MKNEAQQVSITENPNTGRFHIFDGQTDYGSYSRRRDAVRAAERKGLVIA
jgi:hypothetical protein